MKNRISHMNPPMPESICGEEMQSATLDNDVIIEYITDVQGKKVKKLKPLLIKSEPDREYSHLIHSDDDLPKIPENCFTQEREITIASYSETVSSESSSEERTLTTEMENTTSSMEDHIADSPCMKENNVMKIETALHQIATSLQHAAKGYLSLASCIPKLKPCDLPQMIAQIPPPPIDVPVLIRKALTIDGKEKVINHLLRGEIRYHNIVHYFRSQLTI